MIKRLFFITPLIFFLLSVEAQVDGQDQLKREITLYNPYKPSLADARKKSYLPEIIDTVRVNPVFKYDLVSQPYTPAYPLTPVKAASLLPDPLPKLYKSYVKVGMGNNNTPLAELSITGTRSRKGAVGFYAKHYSSNGKVPLENKQRVFAGFMDNDASLFGKKFFRRSFLDLSADFTQKIRYAYGYNTVAPFEFNRKNIRLGYFDAGARISFLSLNLDSTDLSYDFGLSYNYFSHTDDKTMNHIGFNGAMSKMYEGFYIGYDLDIDHYRFVSTPEIEPKYLLKVNPYIRKNTSQWNFNIGLKLWAERNLGGTTKFYFHPDLEFGFSIVPEYIRFFAGLGGKIENNTPQNVFSQNPFVISDSVFRVPNTNHPLIVTAGLKGNSGLGGNYQVSVSYSVINDLLLYSNIVYPDTASNIERGNRFIVLPDDAELLNIHGELSGFFSSRLSFRATANYYQYTLSGSSYAWNKPEWDGRLGFYYNLRNKIIAGTEITALGERKLLVNSSPTGWMTLSPEIIPKPVHVNIGFTAEYRYTKILSFWFKINNVSWDRYYEWAYYPSQMFNFLIGFSYSL